MSTLIASHDGTYLIANKAEGSCTVLRVEGEGPEEIRLRRNRIQIQNCPSSCGAFSPYRYYIEPELLSGFAPKSMAEFTERLQSLGQNQDVSTNLFRLVAFGKSHCLAVYAINDTNYLQLVLLQDLKYPILKITWLEGYQLIFLDEDYSLYYLEFSPLEIGVLYTV